MIQMSKRLEDQSVNMKLFVYGSLRQGRYNYDIYLKNNSKFLQEAYVRGILYSLKGKEYPAIVEGNSLILGELFEVDQETFDRMDEMEGYVPGRFENEYDKIVTEILDKEGNVIDHLPVYWYNVKLASQKALLDEVIESGDYVKYKQSKER